MNPIGKDTVKVIL